MSNSRKYQRYFQPISKEHFSTAGTIRSQGRVGQTSLSQSYSRTPCIGTSPVGYGGCCGTYNASIIFPCCNSSSSEGKSTKTNKGFLMSTVEYPTSVYNNTCIGHCNKKVVKDFSPENNSESARLQRTKHIQMQQWNNLNGELGKTCPCSTSYHIGGRMITNEPYTKRVSSMSSGEYMNTQYLYNNKTEECCV